MLPEVIPISSALIIALSDQRTILNQTSSPWRTTGPRGSFEMISGKTTWLSGLVSFPRCAAKPERSVVYTSQRPASYAATTSSAFSKATRLNDMPFARKKSVMFSSVVVPVFVQMFAPSSSVAELTPRAVGTIIP